MDDAVGLVQVYLRLNGYFTVTEYPVLEAFGHGQHRVATDLDVLAVRFAGAGRPFSMGRARERAFAPDPRLGPPADEVDMIIGEVKEGRATLNRGAADADVLRGALLRFGCCSADDIPDVVEELLHRGKARTHCGHRVRLVAFGSYAVPDARHQTILLGDILDFLQGYIRANWALIKNAQFKDPAFNLLTVIEKARRAPLQRRA
jgi:hypothetical protein